MNQREKLLPVPYMIESSQTTNVRIQITAPLHELEFEYGELLNDAGQAAVRRPSAAWRTAHNRVLEEYAGAWEVLAR